MSQLYWNLITLHTFYLASYLIRIPLESVIDWSWVALHGDPHVFLCVGVNNLIGIPPSPHPATTPSQGLKSHFIRPASWDIHQGWFNVGPTYATLAHHWTSLGWMPHLCCIPVSCTRRGLINSHAPSNWQIDRYLIRCESTVFTIDLLIRYCHASGEIRHIRSDLSIWYFHPACRCT